MKRLVCRKCGSSLFKFKQGDSSVQCYKCKSAIIVNNLSVKSNDKVKYISTSWMHVTG
ncbi:hypothetical protein R9X45_09845 [Wukongibacter sp. M2B1]